MLVVGLLAVAVVTVPNRWGDVPSPVRLAAASFVALTVWSYASIGWSDDPGISLEGANRTLLYLVVFVLFAAWAQQAGVAVALVGAWTAGIVLLAAVTWIRLAGTGADAGGLFVGNRLAEPAGYPNAAAATWLMALWPAVALAAAPAVRWWARGLAAAGATLLVPLALLAQSRGALLAVPISAVLVLTLLPHRVRHLGVLVVVLAGAAIAVPSALDVGDVLGDEGVGDASGELGAAAALTALGALVAGVVVAAAATWEDRRTRAQRATLRHGARIVATVVAVLVAVGGLVAVGDPVDRLDAAWTSFTEDYDGTDADANRLVGGLGSNRDDFYRVALDEFSSHPVLGTGVDTFGQAYLRDGESAETPRYVHSLPLRTVQGLGIVGGALLLLVAAGVLWAAVLVLRAPGRLRRTAAIGALGATGYWTVHGSADWFWEFAGLGAPAFALAGLVCGLVPRPDPPRAAPLRARTAGEVAAVTALALALVAVLAGPWGARRDLDRAAEVFATDPGEAYARLDRARTLDPLSDRPALLEGSIALRFGDLPRARRAFEAALARVPDGAYATLQLGAILSVTGETARARAVLDRAVRLAPRDPIAREARDVVAEGGTVDLVALSRRILVGAETLAP